MTLTTYLDGRPPRTPQTPSILGRVVNVEHAPLHVPRRPVTRIPVGSHDVAAFPVERHADMTMLVS